MWGRKFTLLTSAVTDPQAERPGFYLHPRYRTERPLDSTLLKAKAGFDSFITEKYADEFAGTLTQWSQALLRSPHDFSFLLNSLAADFTGASPVASESRPVRTQAPVEVRQSKFTDESVLNREAFFHALQSSLRDFSEIDAAEFQITWINASPVGSSSDAPGRIETRIRYEITEMHLFDLFPQTFHIETLVRLQRVP